MKKKNRINNDNQTKKNDLFVNVLYKMKFRVEYENMKKQ